MFLKPKMTYLHSRATLYRRFTSIQKANSLNAVYQTTADSLLWLFNADTKAFEPYNGTAPTTVIEVNGTTWLSYGSTFYHYVAVQGSANKWETATAADEGITLLSAKYADIAGLSMNKYYRVKTFDYILKGSVDGTTTQPIKGNITPLTTFTIKHYDDTLNMEQDDLVVIDKHLYSVENPSVDHVHLPRDYCVYSVTLNSIL